MTLTTMGQKFATLPPPIDHDHDRPRVIKPDGTREDYTRISAFAKSLDNSYGIALWKLRWAMLAMARRPDLAGIVSGLRYEDKDHLVTLDRIIDELLAYIGTTAKANYGTAIHLHTEPDADPDHVPGNMRADVDAYNAEVKRCGLKVVATELTVVNHALKILGHLDHIYEHPKYGRIVVDKKTGRLSFPYYAIQTGCYANSQIIDMATGTLTPLNVNLDWALIPYIPAGKGICRMIPVDIRYGWSLTTACLQARAAWKFKEWTGPDLEPDEFTQATDNLQEGRLIKDPILAAIGSAKNTDELNAVWQYAKDKGLIWTEAHTAAGKARLATL